MTPARVPPPGPAPAPGPVLEVAEVVAVVVDVYDAALAAVATWLELRADCTNLELVTAHDTATGQLVLALEHAGVLS